MDTQLSPGDYALLDEENTSVILETPNSIGQRRLGLVEAEATSTFLNNTNFNNKRDCFLNSVLLYYEQNSE